MNYLIAYLRALKETVVFLGVGYFLLSVAFQWSAVADYFAYLSLFSAFAGPISMAISQRKSE